MKKLFALLFSSLLVLPGCSDSPESSDSHDHGDEESTTETTDSSENKEQTLDTDGPISVVTSTSHIRDLLEQIGGEHVEVEGLMGPGVDPHDYEPTTADIEALEAADLVAHNGYHLEEYIVPVFENLEEKGAHLISLEDGLSAENVEILDSLEEDDGLEHDPHIWFSVDNWKIAAEYVAERLSELDPDNAPDYEENAKNYVSELDELEEYIKERIAEIPEEGRYLVTAHDAFQYFGHDFDFEVVAVQGLNPATEAGTADIAEVADLVAEKEIKALFVESSVPTRNIEALQEAVESRGHKIELGGELYSDALGSAEDNADTYITMYRANIDTIVDALK